MDRTAYADGLRLRFLTPEDAEELSAICYPLFREVSDYVPVDVVDAFLDTYLNPDCIREQMTSGTEFAFVFDGDDRVGFIGYAMEGPDLYLSKLYFFDGFRGKGYGSVCFAFIEKKAREFGAGKIFLETNIRNEKGIRFYERHGFKPTGQIVEMRMRMEKWLEPQVL